MDRDEILEDLRRVKDADDLEPAARAARDWLKEHSDDAEVQGALQDAMARAEPRSGRM